MTLYSTVVPASNRGRKESVLKMDTSNSLAELDYVVADVYHEYPNDEHMQQLIKKSEEVILALVEQLKPILKYITIPIRFRTDENEPAAKTFNERCLFLLPPAHRPLDGWVGLSEEGTFFSARRYEMPALTEGRDVVEKRDIFYVANFADVAAWRTTNFGALLKALQDCLTQAQKKRQEHVAAIEKRLGMLTAMLAIVEHRGITD